MALPQIGKGPFDVIKELCYHNGTCVGYIKAFSDIAEAKQKALLGEIDSNP